MMKDQEERLFEERHHLQVRRSTHLYSCIAALHAAGLPAVSSCAPTTCGGCSAPWHLQPCAACGKRPLRKGYPALAARLPPLHELVCGYWNAWLNAVNVAIVVPAGHLVVEADSPAADEELARLIGAATTPTRAARPTRGRAWILRVPGNLAVRSATHLGASRAIDAKGPGATLVVPPSVHVSGHVYEWAPGLAPWEVAVAVASEAVLALLAGTIRSDNTPPLLCPTGSHRAYRRVIRAVSPSPVVVLAREGDGAGACCPIKGTGELVAGLPSPLRRVAEEGFIEGRAFASPSEMRFALALASAHAGAGGAEIREMILAVPGAFKPGDRRDAEECIARDCRSAREAYDHEIASAVPACVERVIVSRGRLPGGARTRATIYAQRLDAPGNQRLRYSCAVILGPPHDGELAGEWLDVARAAGTEVNPARPDAVRLVGREVGVVLDGHGHVRRVVALGKEASEK